MSDKYIEKNPVDFPKIKVLQKYIFGHNGYISGGCFKNIINGETIKDIDIFFLNKEDEAKAKMYYDENEDYIKAYNNDNVDAFTNIKTNVTIELVKKFFGTPKEIMDSFDFTITKMALYNEKYIDEETKEEKINQKLIYHKDFFEDLTMKRIIIDCNNLNMPLGTFNRALRYSKYGYNMCRNSKLFLTNQILKYAKIKSVDEFTIEDFSRELYDGID